MARKNTYENYIYVNERSSIGGALHIGYNDSFVDGYTEDGIDARFPTTRTALDWDIKVRMSEDLAAKFETQGLSFEHGVCMGRFEEDSDYDGGDYYGEEFCYVGDDFALRFYVELNFDEMGGFTCLADTIAERIVEESRTRRWDYDGGCYGCGTPAYVVSDGNWDEMDWVKKPHNFFVSVDGELRDGTPADVEAGRKPASWSPPAEAERNRTAYSVEFHCLP